MMLETYIFHFETTTMSPYLPYTLFRVKQTFLVVFNCLLKLLSVLFCFYGSKSTLLFLPLLLHKTLLFGRNTTDKDSTYSNVNIQNNFFENFLTHDKN